MAGDDVKSLTSAGKINSRSVMLALGRGGLILEERQMTQLAPGAGNKISSGLNAARVGVRHGSVIAANRLQLELQRNNVSDISIAVKLPSELPSDNRTLVCALPLHVDEESHQQRYRRKPQYDFIVRHSLGLVGKPSSKRARLASSQVSVGRTTQSAPLAVTHYQIKACRATS